jgi:hypothetical protein
VAGCHVVNGMWNADRELVGTRIRQAAAEMHETQTHGLCNGGAREAQAPKVGSPEERLPSVLDWAAQRV